jgi:hypothetical protein
MVGTADSINKIIDVKEDDPTLSEKLTEISKKHDAVLMACIAPYVGLKVSPTKTVNAQMGLSEEFAVETAINQTLTKTDVKKLLLLVNSPGGLVQSSYKVASVKKNIQGNHCFCSAHCSKWRNFTCHHWKQDSDGYDEPTVTA